MSFPDFSSGGESTLFLCAERMGVVCVCGAVNIETLWTDNELIVAQTCECPFVKYCIVIVVDLGVSVSRSLLWQGVFV